MNIIIAISIWKILLWRRPSFIYDSNREQYRGNISSRFSRNSKALASEFLENLEENVFLVQLSKLYPYNNRTSSDTKN